MKARMVLEKLRKIDAQYNNLKRKLELDNQLLLKRMGKISGGFHLRVLE